MTDLFISYSHEDEAWARRLAGELEAEGFSVWWDHTIPPGRSWEDYIGRALEDARAVIVLWSATSIASNWVKEEASHAEQAGKFVSLAIDNSMPPMGFRRYQAGQFAGFNWNRSDPRWRLLIDDLRVRLQDGPSPRSTQAPRPPRPPRGGGIAPVVIGFLVLALAAGGGWFAWRQMQLSSQLQDAAAAREASAELASASGNAPDGGATAAPPAPPATLDPAQILGRWEGNMYFSGSPSPITFIFAEDGTFHAIAGYQGRGSYDGLWEIDGMNLRWGCSGGSSVCYITTPVDGVMRGTAISEADPNWRVDFRLSR